MNGTAAPLYAQTHPARALIAAGVLLAPDSGCCLGNGELGIA